MKLYFSIKELCHSDTADKNKLLNTPNVEQTDNMLNLIYYVLQPLRERIGQPIIINSGFRCPKVNSLVRGASNSQHLEGKAVDFHIKGMAVSEIIRFIKATNIEYDQLINEYDKWVHISFNKGHNRMQSFSII